MWELRVARRAERTIGRVPKRERDRLLTALEQMRTDPLRGDVVRLKYQRAAFRRRVGDWRLFFDLDWTRTTIDVTEVVRRTTTTYRRRR